MFVFFKYSTDLEVSSTSLKLSCRDANKTHAWADKHACMNVLFIQFQFEPCVNTDIAHFLLLLPTVEFGSGQSAH